ncbi:hypothetical protein PS15m_008826 [Mucor circinelloides]
MGKRKRIPALSLSRKKPPPAPAHPACPAHAPTSTPTPNLGTMKPELLQAAVVKLNEWNYQSQVKVKAKKTPCKNQALLIQLLMLLLVILLSLLVGFLLLLLLSLPV